MKVIKWFSNTSTKNFCQYLSNTNVRYITNMTSNIHRLMVVFDACRSIQILVHPHDGGRRPAIAKKNSLLLHPGVLNVRCLNLTYFRWFHETRWWHDHVFLPEEPFLPRIHLLHRVRSHVHRHQPRWLPQNCLWFLWWQRRSILCKCLQH